MGLLSFIKDAGEKLFHGNQGAVSGAQAAQPAAQPDNQATQQADPQVANANAGKAIRDFIAASGIDASGLNVTFDGATATVTVEGQAPDQATKEKIVLLAGNVAGVEKVDDRVTVAQSETASTMYTVKPGDTLSKIAQQFYGNASRYQVIFEANQPMLKDPNRIYPGQMLRIPPQAGA